MQIDLLIYQDLWFSRLVLKTKRLEMLNALEKLCLVFEASLEKQKARLENQKRHI